MFRITISGKYAHVSDIDGISKPLELTQRVYRWGDSIGIYRPSLSWEHQWSVEQRIPCATIRKDETLYYIEQVQYPNIQVAPVCLDDVYDEHVTMYTIHSHILVLEMQSMCIFIGEKSKLQTLLPIDVSNACVSKTLVESNNCELLKQPQDLQPLMKPLSTPPRSLLVEMRHDHSQHRSHPQSREGKQHQQVHGKRLVRNLISHDQQEYVQQPLPSHASQPRGSGEYVPKKQGVGQNGVSHRHSKPMYSRPINHLQYRQERQTVPLSARGREPVQVRVRRPEFVPEEP
jgi:hypothetical protein